LVNHKVGIVDYKAGNLKSVETALRYLGANFFISDKPQDFSKASHLVFPGVGDARAAMSSLNETGLADAIKDFYYSGKPVLGICLGCQIIFSHSTERDTNCLNLINGEVVKFPLNQKIKIPHMGWNQVIHKDRHIIFSGIPEKSWFYFVHSYYPKPEKSEVIIGETEYNITFASAVSMENLVAMQFHPEKSGKMGLKLLSNFLTRSI